MSARIVTVLVVDDRPDVRLSLLYMLEASGYVVAEAADGRQAMPTIAQRQVDVVLADLSMPTMDGDELIRTIRARPMANPKTILMTGTAPMHNAVGQEARDLVG